MGTLVIPRSIRTNPVFRVNPGFRDTGVPGGEGGGGDPPPEDPPVLTTDATLVSRTQTSITITFTANQFVQAFIEYGLTAGYGSESAHETSFDYQTHVQTISGLTAGTNYHFRVHVINQDTEETLGADTEFETEDVPGPGIDDFDEGMTYTDISWASVPVSPSNGRAAAQNLINTAGSGTDATHPIRHVLVPGARYDFTTSGGGNNLTLPAGAHDITFEGGGTEVTPSSTGAHTGGARWHTTGGTNQHRVSIIRSEPNFTSTTAQANRIRFHNITFTGTGGSSPHEQEHGIQMVGWSNVRVSHCTFQNLRGDGIYMGSSRLFTNPYGADGGAFYSRNILVDNSAFIDPTFRQAMAVITAQQVSIQDCYLPSIDIEPDMPQDICGDVELIRCTFNSADGNDVPLIAMTRPNSTPGTFTYVGYLKVIDCVFIHALTGPLPYHRADIATDLGNVNKSGTVTITGNTRTANAYAGPAVRLNNHAGGGQVENNHGFITSGSFLSSSNNGTIDTSSGNS